ncbi:hypothetical protein P1A29_02235 [Staphylococcus equorum]|uniref:hypothetical protein n=1 Tax=Staphylococcus equorum TaxID=246432 RepID=UPI00255580E7|nr:hypothetical protein [Staphylococcus equorum]MDK9859259.1 hypothetical protein [Staphylococcus equorum]
MDTKELMIEENRVINRLTYWKIQKSNVEQHIKALECKRNELRKQRYKFESGGVDDT